MKLNNKIKRGGSHKHPLYGPVFMDMITRCSNSSRKGWENYGGRGIKVCDRWNGENGFKFFLEDMGERPRRFFDLRQAINVRQKAYQEVVKV